jgi:hypothetical protein
MRVLLSGIVGGILIFAWAYANHAMLPFGRMGFSEVPDEAKWQASLDGAITQPGLYIFPWSKAKPTKEEHAAWAEKWKAGPSGLLILQPKGKDPMDKKTLGIELGSSIVFALIASWVLTLAAATYAARVAVVTFMGVLSWLAIDVSLWNMFGLPTDYLLGQLAIEGGGCLIAGLAMAAIIRPQIMDMDAEMPL